ncbi:MAG: alpha-L-rhamnosidase C-terminal domain-containing protein, partial [Dysgonamonadaceae bacterium]|nr:alpha-L-rhamnosidase C-terminal domain-containing protein [Dysgonamonadaceae bacterium]
LFCDFLPWAKASIETPYGTVSSSWKKEDTKFEWNIVIPPNTTGWVAPPFQEEFTVNGEKMEHFNFLQIEKSNGQTYYKFPSGNFKIICHNIK